MTYDELPDVVFETAAEPQDAMQINRELNLARRIIEDTGSNLFLTGKAGTGKTTFLRHLRDNAHKRMIVLAPTGVAAINAGGMTIHSFFQLPFSPYIPGFGFPQETDRKRYQFSKAKRHVLNTLDLLVIDEVSMVRPDTLDAIDEILRRYRDSSQPFGGVQLLLIGDMRQLAPIIPDAYRDMLQPHYRSPYFFESRALADAGYMTVELQTVYRQNDTEFVGMLNSIRDGRATHSVLEALNRRVDPAKAASAADTTIRLTTHNRQADSINASRMDALAGNTYSYTAKIEDKFPENSYPADLHLELKPRARVMFIKNDTGRDRRYYNGLTGTVVRLGNSAVTVQPDNGADPIEVGYETWQNVRYDIDPATGAIAEVSEGSFSQVPLRPAWAITIHKSQGLTFERVRIDAHEAFAPGQLYVALSRCRTLGGLTLGAPLPASAVIVDSRISDFMSKKRAVVPDAETVCRLRDDYYRSLLRQMFDFKAATLAFSDYSRAVKEFVAPIHPELYSGFNAAEKIFDTEIAQVGRRFNDLYTSQPLDTDKAETNDQFNTKIANGCRYFIEKLKPLVQLAESISLIDIDNKSYRRRLTASLENFLFQAGIKLRVMNTLSERPFSPDTYLKAKAEAAHAAESDAVATVRKALKPAKAVKEKAEKKPKGYSARLSLDMLRDGRSVMEIADERGLTVSTITGHLCKFIADGELDISDVIPANSLEAIRQIIADSAVDSDFKTLRDNCLAVAEPWQFELFYRSRRRE